MDDSNYFEALMMGGSATLEEGQQKAVEEAEAARTEFTEEVEKSVRDWEKEIKGEMKEYKELRKKCGLFQRFRFIQGESSEEEESGGGEE